MVILRLSTAVAHYYAISTVLDYPKQVGREGQITVHGFRSTFRDYIAEKTELDGSIAEHALAHKLKDKSVAAYQRRAMMDKCRLMI